MKKWCAGWLVAAALAAGCTTRQPAVVVPAFYYWKTTWQLGKAEKEILKGTQTHKIYLRLFDVAWNATTHQPYPESVIRFNDTAYRQYELVPVFYITTEVLRKLDSVSTDTLAHNINRLLLGLNRTDGLQYTEIQVDADWTKTTRDDYFALLDKLKQQPAFRNKKVSCTIRLHQLSHLAAIGVPPVDRGLLMCYNMGDLMKWGAHNSILDMQTLHSYLDPFKSYPLQLDVALPLFEWAVLFDNRQFKGLLNGVTAAELQQHPDFVLQEKNLYQALRTTMLHGYTVAEGQVVRVEPVTMDAVQQAAALTTTKIKNDTTNVILFHLDSALLSKYTTHELEKIFSTYR
jgi:hypothetical protein